MRKVFFGAVKWIAHPVLNKLYRPCFGSVISNLNSTQWLILGSYEEPLEVNDYDLHANIKRDDNPQV